MEQIIYWRTEIELGKHKVRLRLKNLVQKNKIDLIYNTICVMNDVNGTTWYVDLVCFWIYRNRERKKNNIIKGLMEVIKEMISIEELNLLVVLHVPKNRSGNEGVGAVEIKKPAIKVNKK